MLLYVANCTKQDLDFIYRLPGDPRMKMVKIKIGRQERIHNKDMPLETVEYIVAQHQKYGLVKVEEVVRAGRKDFVGSCWSFKPIDIEKMLYAVDHNDGVIHDRGLEIRKEAAVAASDALNKDTSGSLSALEIEIAEEGNAEGYSESIEVRGDDVAPDRDRGERGGKRRRR